MPLYFLDFDANGAIIEGDTGSVFPAVENMHKEARAAFCALAKDDIGKDEETPAYYKVLVHGEGRYSVDSVAMTPVGAARERRPLGLPVFPLQEPCRSGESTTAFLCLSRAALRLADACPRSGRTGRERRERR